MAKGDFVGEFELFVMLAVAQIGDGAYGIRIRHEISRRTGRDIVIGAVYATLGRLHDKGLITFDLSESQPVQGGRARKCYALTSDGRRSVSHATTMIDRMRAGLDVQFRGAPR